MKTVKFGSNEIVLFDSIDVLPPNRESLMNFYLLSEMGIGHTFESINNHMSGIKLAAANNDQETLHRELENMMLSYLTIASKYNPKYIAWICLIESINGEKLTDLSENNLIEVGQKLSEEGGISFRWAEIFSELKKNFPTNWLQTSQIDQEEITVEDWTLSDVTI